MKLSYFAKILVFLTCTLFYAQQTACLLPQTQRDLKTELDKPTSLTTEQNKKLTKLADNLDTATFDALISSMQTLEANLEYWRKAEKSPTYHAIHNPAGWLDTRETTTAIRDCITDLEELEKEHAKALGAFYLHQQTKKTLTPPDYAFNSLMFQLPCFKKAAKILKNQTLDYEQLSKKLQSRATTVRLYKKTFDKKISSVRQPSHVARNWWKYVVGGIAAGCAIWQINKHKQEIPEWYKEGCSIISQQWTDRIVTPAREIWKNLTQGRTKKMPAGKTPPNGKNEMPEQRPTLEDNFKEQLTEYFTKRDKALAAYDTVEQSVDAVMDGDPVELYNDMFQDAKHIRTNIFRSNFQLPSSILLLGQYLHVQGKQELEIQKINIMLGAMFPAVLALYGTQKASSAIFSKLFLKKGIYKVLQNRVSQMYDMLIDLIDLNEKNMSLEQHGKLLYYLTTLEKYAALTPREHHDTFKRNIERLKSTRSSAQTKIMTIEQMYRMYPFLQHSAN